MARTARKKTTADDVYNARKRFARSATRNLQRAQESTGATAARYKQLAREDLKQAIETYDKDQKKPRYMKEIREAARELNVDINDRIALNQELTTETKSRVITRSLNTLEKNLRDENIRRDRNARAILSNDELGSRIFGGLVDIWKDKATVWNEEQGRYTVDNELIEPILLEYFKVDTIADVLDALENAIGSQLYEISEDSGNFYENVKILLQTKVIENTLVQ